MFNPLEVDDLLDPVRELSLAMNGTIIYKKGLIDVLSDGERTAIVSTKGSMKRCGGQGDVLAGMIGTFVNYGDDPMFSAMMAGCATRVAAKQAFNKKGHSLVTPDII